MKSMEFRVRIWPPRWWFMCRVDDCACDWTVFFGPFALKLSWQ